MAVGLPLLEASSQIAPPFKAQDPGPRQTPSKSGTSFKDLTPTQHQLFIDGHHVFNEAASVRGTLPATRPGLGPRFNLDSCGGCHTHPHLGGTSPKLNPQVELATREGAANEIPSFITADGPVREVRFKFKQDGSRDDGVQALFTISGRSDAPGCFLQQPNFKRAAALNNLSFRIPTPMFGAGLIEAIDDDTILANIHADGAKKFSSGIRGRANGAGRPNIDENDRTISRFGWKAQIKSLELFVAQAFNVEQGITNDLYPQEIEESASCRFNMTPESTMHLDAVVPFDVLSDVVKATRFVQFLAPPEPLPDNESIIRGRTLFGEVGCALCHTPMLRTGNATHAFLRDQEVKLYSDLVLHNMGPGLADDINQGRAQGDEFRTAPLWGLSDRFFLLHDGRTKDLLEAIKAHASRGDWRYPPSEANDVIVRFDRLTEIDKQHVLNFLRGL
ncbi:di-heme oxidoredictase family protein [Nitrospira sp. KM1]|uniref:di-heme oxidoredictase family protein n=1 Tax=Nitrospira sp. KM1 TaxID=1936990 RepID=UPI00351A1BE5